MAYNEHNEEKISFFAASFTAIYAHRGGVALDNPNFPFLFLLFLQVAECGCAGYVIKLNLIFYNVFGRK